MGKVEHPGWIPAGWEEPVLFSIAAVFELIGWWEQLLDKLADLTRKPPRFFIAPPRLVRQPIGREKDRRRLNRRLRREQMLNLTGPGGLGKTTLLQYFLERYQHRFDNVIYLFTGTAFSDRSDYLERNAEQFLQSFTGPGSELVTKLKIQFDPLATELDRFKIVVGCMADLPGRSLLVIDNCFDLPPLYLEQFSRLAGWRILITSRTQIANLPEFELAHLDPADALRLFRRIFEIQGDDNRLSDLLRRYDYHTKTIELLAHYARDRTWSVADMENELRQKHLLELPDYALPSFDGRSMGLAGHLIATFALELSDEAQNLMRQFALLPPKGAQIAPELLSEKNLAFMLGCDEQADQVRLHNLLETLIRLNWLERVDSGIFIHPVIQEVAHYELKPSIEQCRTLVQRVTAMLSIDQAKDNPVDKFRLLIFGETLMAGIGENPDSDYSNLMSRIGWILEDLGQYEKARDLLEAALASDLKNFGQEHPTVAVSQSNLANVYYSLGQYEKARDLLEAALTSDLKNFGQEHPDVAVSQNNLAFVLKDMGEEKAAIQLMQKAYALRLKLLGPEHPYTKGSAQTLRDWGAEPQDE